MAVGARLSLAIGLAVTLLAGTIGVLLGLLAAVSWQADRQRYRVRGRCADCGTGSGAGYRRQRALFARRRVVVGVLTFSGWVSYQRVVRAQTKVLLGSAFVEASRSIGGNRWRIARKHLLPNAIGPVIVIATQQVAAVILFESALSYLGLGVPADTVTLGGMVSAGGKRCWRPGGCLPCRGQ